MLTFRCSSSGLLRTDEGRHEGFDAPAETSDRRNIFAERWCNPGATRRSADGISPPPFPFPCLSIFVLPDRSFFLVDIRPEPASRVKRRLPAATNQHLLTERLPIPAYSHRSRRRAGQAALQRREGNAVCQAPREGEPEQLAETGLPGACC